MKADKKKGIVIAIGLFVLSMIIGLLLSPYFINYYFSNQPIYSISESIKKLNLNEYSYLNGYTSYKGNDGISLGQTIVLRGYLNDNFILINTGMSSDEYIQQQIIPVMDKINCIPTKEGYYNIVGAYNLGNGFNDELGNFGFYKKLDFYALWFVGGC